jgi:TonB family protein
MFSKKTVLALFAMVVVLSMIAAQCGAPATPQTIVEKVVETVVVEKEGKTVVEMQLSANGDVTRLSVAESSGKDVLDEAAVAMVKRALPLPKPPPGVRSVRVPVVFRLQG